MICLVVIVVPSEEASGIRHQASGPNMSLDAPDQAGEDTAALTQFIAQFLELNSTAILKLNCDQKLRLDLEDGSSCDLAGSEDTPSLILCHILRQCCSGLTHPHGVTER